MILHKILQGDDAWKGLPFGLARLRALERIHDAEGFFQEKFLVDGRQIEIQQEPPFQYLRITSTGQYFEFFTSGKPVTTDIIHGIDDFTVYKAATIGVAVSASAASPTIRGGDRLYKTGPDSRIRRGQQIKLIDEPVAYPGPGKKLSKALYEAWTPNHSHTGLHLRCYNLQQGGLWSNRGPLSAHVVRDIGFDTPYEDGQGLLPVRSAYLRDEADWPRANGIQTVTDAQYGDRTFAIYVDAFNTFHVFPLSAITPFVESDPPLQNVASSAIRHLTPNLPAWGYKPTTKLSDWWDANHTPGLIDFPELDWKLHPDGTEACAIMYQREAANFDSGYFDVDQGTAPFDETAFNAFLTLTGVASRHFGTFSPSYLPQRYNSGPGLIKVVITITLTGVDDNEFDASLEVAEIRAPTETEYCTLVAGYCWHDIKAPDWTEENEHYAAKRGDMVVLDIERHIKPATGSTASFMSLKNFAPERLGEIRAFYAAALVDYDLPTLSFVFTMPWSTSYPRALNKRAGAPGPDIGVQTYVVDHIGLNVWTLNTQREVLFPDTIDPVAKAGILSFKDGSPRSVVSGAGWELMPLNDLRDWTDLDLKNLRDYYTTEVFHYKNVPYTIPSTELATWWTSGMSAYLVPTGLFFIETPRFGWHVYTDEIINRLHVSPYSTFFAHPNGTWAFYDQSYIYNKHGMNSFGPSGFLDQLTAFDATQLEHCILDRVHFSPKAGAIGFDTSFRELYNKAVLKGTENGSLQEPFDQLTKADLRATFTKETHTDVGSGVSWLQLKVDWYPARTAYYMETGYEGGAYNSGSTSGAGGLKDLNMGGLFFPEPGYGGEAFILHDEHTPITFSSCVLIT